MPWFLFFLLLPLVTPLEAATRTCCCSTSRQCQLAAPSLLSPPNDLLKVFLLLTLVLVNQPLVECHMGLKVSTIGFAVHHGTAIAPQPQKLVSDLLT